DIERAAHLHLVILRGSIGRRILSTDPKDSWRGGSERLQQCAPDHAEIGIGVIRRDHALVAEEELDFAPPLGSERALLRHAAIERLRCRSARKKNSARLTGFWRRGLEC